MTSVRGSAIFASIWTTVQGVIYLVFCTFGVMAYRCELDLTSGNIVNYIINFVYFYNSDCAEKLNLSDIDDSLSILNITYQKTAFTAIRTYDWMLVYLVITSLWIVASIVLFFGAVLDASGNAMYATVIPWCLVTTGTLLADLVATITYSIDIAQTTTFKKLVDFMDVDIPDGGGVVNVTQVIEETEIFGTWAPSAAMVVYFSRVFIFWLVNLILLVYVLSEANKRNRVTPEDDKPSLPPMISQRPAPLMTRPQPPPVAPKPVGYSHVRPASDLGNGHYDLKPTFRSGMDRQSSYDPNGRLGSVDRLNSQYDAKNNDTSSYIPDPNTENWLARHNGSAKTNLSTQPTSALKPTYNERPISPKNQGADELRSQLPWSYFHDKREAPKPRQAADGYLPPVPVPDYTLHFPKRRREIEMGRNGGSSYNNRKPSEHSMNSDSRDSKR